MYNQSPLVPQGATPPRVKSGLYFKVLMILGVHVVLIGGMLLQGCRDTTAKDQVNKDNTATTTADTTATPANPANPGPADVSVPPTINPGISNVVAGTTAAAPAGQQPPAMGTAAAAPGTTPSVTPAPAPTEAKEYVIVKGDRLGAIAKKNGIALKALMDANPGIDAKKLKIGQKIQVPAATAAVAVAGATGAPGAADAVGADVYTVKSGDMLLRIAKAHNTTVKKIMALNDLKSTSIRAGQKLKLPAAKASTPEPVTTPAPATGASASAVTPPVMRVSSAVNPTVAAN
jgi:LysM repeat protein